jgi:hypothetical protein
VALLPTLLAIAIGVALGLRWGGRLSNLPSWRPPLAPTLLGSVGVLVLLDVLPLGGSVAVLARLGALGGVLAFAVVNLRVGGMVLVVAGVGLNLLVTLVNWGMPVSGSALVSAGIVPADQLDTVVLHGGRRLADGATLGFLGDVLPLPWGHVVSPGDLVLLVGLALVTASVARRYEVGGGRRTRGGRRGGPNDYRVALDALGRGPAPRRGPGLHPSRLPKDRSVVARRRRPGTAPR